MQAVHAGFLPYGATGGFTDKMQSLGHGFRQVEAHQPVFAAQEKFPVRQYRRSPARITQLRHLPRADFLTSLRIRSKQTKPPALTEHDEFAVRQNRRATAKRARLSRAVRGPAFVAIPHELAGFEFDAAEARVRFVAS